MNILLTTMTFAKYSAVCNDLTAMYFALTNIWDVKNINCKVYAQRIFADAPEYFGKNTLCSEKDIKKILSDKDAVFIYHHSCYWEKGEQLLRQAGCKIVFRYHNITPPEFFAGYSESYRLSCQLGTEQTARFIRDFPDALWLCASQYNANELAGVPKENIFICPPFNKTEEWTRTAPDEEVLKKLNPVSGIESIAFSDSQLSAHDKQAAKPSEQTHCKPINLLFVGRVAPNKGYMFLIDILYCYVQNYGSNIMLRLIGDLDESLQGYTLDIKLKCAARGLKDNVEFIGEIDDSKLLAYYMGSDFFVSASEHEGFLVPAAEAQYLKLPVIARAKAAQPETIGEGGLLLGDDPAQYAAAIHVLSQNAGYRAFLIDAGHKNFTDRFSNAKITENFTQFMLRTVT